MSATILRSRIEKLVEEIDSEREQAVATHKNESDNNAEMSPTARRKVLSEIELKLRLILEETTLS